MRTELSVDICSCILGGGGGVVPYMGYIGMYGPKGYGFSAVLVINRVSILAILPPFWGINFCTISTCTHDSLIETPVKVWENLRKLWKHLPTVLHSQGISHSPKL